ncbi:MAG: hypothetical protein ACRC0X_05275 [Brevinema sp.]
MEKYELERLLLYLENRLSEDQSREISEYLMKNPELMKYLVELTKIKAYSESNVNKISFNKLQQGYQQYCSGLVFFLQEQRVAFRGVSDLQSYQYAFLDLQLNFFIWENSWNLKLESTRQSFYCELLSNDLSFLFQKKIKNAEIFSLSFQQSYYLFVHLLQDIKILEISL